MISGSVRSSLKTGMTMLKRGSCMSQEYRKIAHAAFTLSLDQMPPSRLFGEVALLLPEPDMQDLSQIAYGCRAPSLLIELCPDPQIVLLLQHGGPAQAALPVLPVQFFPVELFLRVSGARLFLA